MLSDEGKNKLVKAHENITASVACMDEWNHLLLDDTDAAKIEQASEALKEAASSILDRHAEWYANRMRQIAEVARRHLEGER